MKGDVDFDIPITAPLKSVLERMFNYPSEYVFWSFRGRKTDYLNPSALNQALKRMGYGGIHTAHGTRSTIQTCGQEVLGFERELIQRYMKLKHFSRQFFLVCRPSFCRVPRDQSNL